MLLTATSSVHNLEYEPVELRECIHSMILLVDQDWDGVVLLEKILKLLENFGRFVSLGSPLQLQDAVTTKDICYTTEN